MQHHRLHCSTLAGGRLWVVGCLIVAVLGCGTPGGEHQSTPASSGQPHHLTLRTVFPRQEQVEAPLTAVRCVVLRVTGPNQEVLASDQRVLTVPQESLTFEEQVPIGSNRIFTVEAFPETEACQEDTPIPNFLPTFIGESDPIDISLAGGTVTVEMELVEALVLRSPGNQTSAEGTAVALQIVAGNPDGDPLAFSATGLPLGLSFDSAMGRISGVVAETAAIGSPYLVTITVADGTDTVSTSFLWTINNQPLRLTNPGPQTTREGTSVVLQLGASDPDGDLLTFNAAGLPPGLSLDRAVGRISGVVAATAAARSPYTVTITVADGMDTVSTSFPWTITQALGPEPSPNQPPRLSDPGPQNSAEGTAVALQLGASDPDGDRLSFTATNLPPGLSLDPATGLISGTLSFTAADTYIVTVTVSDGALSSAATFTWAVNNVNRRPDITNVGNQKSLEGNTVSLQIVASDPDGDPLTFSATGLPPASSIDPTTGLITGTIDLMAADGSPYMGMITVSDGTATNSINFSWRVIRAVFHCSAGDVACLIDAITVANDTDEDTIINLEAGTYTLTQINNDTNGPNGLPSITTSLTIQVADNGNATIQREASAPPFRIFHIESGGNLTLDGLTITGGLVGGGDCDNDTATHGGGFFNGGTLTLTNSTVSDNSAGCDGGGIENFGTVTLTRSTLSNNTAGRFGGGMNSFVAPTSTGTITLIESTVSDNEAGLDGGGVENSAHATITRSTLSNNTAGRFGGGIANVGERFELTNSTISGNTARFGGGIENFGTGGMFIMNNVTITQNTASERVAGLSNQSEGSTVTLANTLIAQNIGSDCGGTFNSQGFNLIGNAQGCDGFGADDQVDLPDDLIDTILDPELRLNGGFTRTHALLAGSPAIDAGNDQAAPGSGGNACASVDQRGVSRPSDGDNNGIAFCDIGAVEQTCIQSPEGLISWWPGESDATDIADDNDGTLQNGTTFVSGLVGQAFNLAGEAYVLIGNPANLKALLAGITIDAWVNPSSPPPQDDPLLTDIYAIATKWGQDAMTDAYGLWLRNPAGTVMLSGAIGVSGVSDRGFSGGTIPIGQWTHVAMTYDSETGDNRLYVNGDLVNQRVHLGGITQSDLHVRIGAEDSSLPRHFQGLIDEVEIYNRALSQSEIQAIFNAGSAGKCKD